MSEKTLDPLVKQSIIKVLASYGEFRKQGTIVRALAGANVGGLPHDRQTHAIDHILSELKSHRTISAYSATITDDTKNRVVTIEWSTYLDTPAYRMNIPVSYLFASNIPIWDVMCS